MIKEDKAPTWVGLIGLVLLTLILTTFLITNFSPIHVAFRQAIAACEKSLPRDQECEYVITARVKEN